MKDLISFKARNCHGYFPRATSILVARSSAQRRLIIYPRDVTTCRNSTDLSRRGTARRDVSQRGSTKPLDKCQKPGDLSRRLRLNVRTTRGRRRRRRRRRRGHRAVFAWKNSARRGQRLRAIACGSPLANVAMYVCVCTRACYTQPPLLISRGDTSFPKHRLTDSYRIRATQWLIMHSSGRGTHRVYT